MQLVSTTHYSCLIKFPECFLLLLFSLILVEKHKKTAESGKRRCCKYADYKTVRSSLGAGKSFQKDT